MVTYAQNEASSTDISKQFGHYLSNVSNGIVEKRLKILFIYIKAIK